MSSPGFIRLWKIKSPGFIEPRLYLLWAQNCARAHGLGPRPISALIKSYEHWANPAFFRLGKSQLFKIESLLLVFEGDRVGKIVVVGKFNVGEKILIAQFWNQVKLAAWTYYLGLPEIFHRTEIFWCTSNSFFSKYELGHNAGTRPIC